jgi:hypothetical protein
MRTIIYRDEVEPWNRSKPDYSPQVVTAKTAAPEPLIMINQEPFVWD